MTAFILDSRQREGQEDFPLCYAFWRSVAKEIEQYTSVEILENVPVAIFHKNNVMLLFSILLVKCAMSDAESGLSCIQNR